MDLDSWQPRLDGGDRLLRGKGNVSFEFTTSVPYGYAIQTKHLRSFPEYAESDSKSVQVPSLSADNSSRASSINNIEYHSETADSSRWLQHEDSSGKYISSLGRSKSPTSMDLGTLPDRPLCDPRHLPLVVSEVQPKPTNSKQASSIVTACQTLSLSAGAMPVALYIAEPKSPEQQPALDSELSDSDSESEEDSDNDDIPNDEWSGANDNIESALYEAVYPDTKLAAHLILTMYQTIVLSNKKRISSKIYSWQERNIATCCTDSGTTSTTKETSPQGTSNAANKSSPKRDRQPSSLPDENTGDDEDDSRRKKRKGKVVDNEPGIPQQRLACLFYKKDSVKYSAVKTGHKSCAGPGYPTITSLK